MSDQVKGWQVDRGGLPERYPTHLHPPEIWEALGRAVATFGFLEEVLARAIFAVSATREYEDEEKLAEAFSRWEKKLSLALSDQLGGLIQTFGKDVRDHGSAEHPGFRELIEDLDKARVLRNVLCHGSWRAPDRDGSSELFFVNRQGEKFANRVDLSFLENVQSGTVDLAVAVMNTVTAMGWQFPGSNGPGKPILPSGRAK